jgi:hypothetical protein
MNDPRRLLDAEPGEFPARLLRSWQSCQPRARALQRTAVALGLGPAAFSAASAAAAVSGAGAKAAAASAGSMAAKLVLLKWFGAAVLGGTVVAGAAQYGFGGGKADQADESSRQETSESVPAGAKDERGEDSEETASAAERPEAQSLAGGDQPAAGEGTGQSPAVVGTPKAAANEADRAQAAPAPGEVEGSGDPEGGSSLAKDIHALDRARQALGRRDAETALRALDELDRGMPTGVLSPEATVVRIEALLLRGDRARAAGLARRFISEFPRSPHVPRLKAVAEGQ